jgi:hypothetical protein
VENFKKFSRQKWKIINSFGFHSEISFTSLFCKFFLQSTTHGSKMTAAPQLVGGINFHRNQHDGCVFSEIESFSMPGLAFVLLEAPRD